MAFNVNQFRAALTGDGARPNLFSVTMPFPTFVNIGQAAGQKLQFMARSAQLPGSTIGTVTQNYFGRELKFAGNRTFADWTITVVNDEDFLIRNAFEQWLNGIDSHVSNIRTSGPNPDSYSVSQVYVQQFNKDGTPNPYGLYNFVGMFPTDLTPIDLDWGANDSMEEFSVTFTYQYWTNVQSTDV